MHEGLRAPYPMLKDYDGPRQPRVKISWYEAEAYAAWRGGNLPTEAQWECLRTPYSVPTVAERELFFLAWDGQLTGVPIALAPKLKIGEPVAMFATSAEARAAIHSLPGFDVSADGQRFLIPIVTSAGKSEIVVMQNWEAAMRRSRGKLN